MGYLVTGMADTVANNPSVIISDLVLSGDSMSTYTLQTGIKASEKALDMYGGTVDVSNGDYTGADDGYAGGVYLKDVAISVEPLFIKEKYAKQTLEKKLAQLAEVKGSNPDEIVFENLIAEFKGKELNKYNEKSIWLGATDASLYGLTLGNAVYFDGIVKQLVDDASTISNGWTPTELSTASDASIAECVEAMHDSMPEVMIEEDTILAMSPTLFKKYRRYIYKQSGAIDLNTINEGPVTEMMVPGTNVLAKSTSGLSTSNFMVLQRPANTVIGVDLEGEDDTIEFKYVDAILAYRLFATWKLGVKVLRPYETVINIG